MKIKPVKPVTQNPNQLAFANRIAHIYMILILCVFPVVFTNFYYNILETKYLFYCISTVAMALLISLQCIKHRIWFQFQHLSFTDWCLIAFLLVSTISTITSPYSSAAFWGFWGKSGRYSGLFLFLLYGLAYFFVTRFYRFQNHMIDFFLYVSVFVCTFGITDYFKMDVLGFKRNMLENQKSIYTSTMGNINTYTVYVALAIAISLILFATEKQFKKCVFYYVCMTLGFYAIIMGNSDNAYLAMAALFGFSPFYLFGTKSGLLRYVMATATLFTVIFSIDILNALLPDQVYGIVGVFNIVSNSRFLPYVTLLLWLLVGVLYRLFQVNKQGDAPLGKQFRTVWGILVAVVFCVILYLFYDCNFAGNAETYGSLGNYLLFQDSWGTSRGYIWRIAMEHYNSFTPWQKIFGYGPDTFGILTMMNNSYEMETVYKQFFDSVHNEYLQYLVTVGAVGLMSYLAFFISAIVVTVKKAKHNPCMMAVAFAVICYGVQAVVNINLPIATPIMWTFLMVGVGKDQR